MAEQAAAAPRGITAELYCPTGAFASLWGALAELRAHQSPSVDHAMRRFAGLRYEPAYAESLFARVKEQFGGREVPFRWAPVEQLPLDRIGWSNQHGFCRRTLIGMLTDPELSRSPICVLRDADRLIVWDGSHRYAGHRLRGERVIACRVVVLGAFRAASKGEPDDG